MFISFYILVFSRQYYTYNKQIPSILLNNTLKIKITDQTNVKIRANHVVLQSKY